MMDPGLPRATGEEIEVIIIEDEEIWRMAIASDLDKLGYKVTGTADSFESAVILLNNASYDIALVDINLNNKNSGLELGKMISHLYKKPFIYITAEQGADTVTQAVETKPAAYLVKPVNTASLVVAVQTAIANSHSANSSVTYTAADEKQDFFFVKQGNKYRKVDWKDVVHLRSEKNYTLIYSSADNAEYAIRSALKRTLSYIIPAHLKHNFIQVNRAEVINLPFLTELKGEEARTQFGTYTVTDGYLPELKTKMQIIS